MTDRTVTSVSEPVRNLLIVTACVVVVLLALSLAVKVCGAELSEWRKLLRGLAGSAIKELKFAGGRAAIANVILCVVFALVCLAIAMPSVLSELRALFTNAPEHSVTLDILLFIILGVFFGISVYYCYSLDRYEQEMKK